MAMEGTTGSAEDVFAEKQDMLDALIVSNVHEKYQHEIMPLNALIRSAKVTPASQMLLTIVCLPCRANCVRESGNWL